MSEGPGPAVLLLSHSREPFCTDRVARGLQQRGARPRRLDTDTFPSSLPLEARLDPQRPPALQLAGGAIDAQAVWFWRLWPAALDERLGAAHREAGQREASATLLGFLDLLHELPWIDPPSTVRAAENKTRQLRLAREEGLAIPPTLITADPSSVRRFFEEHDGAIVAKLQTALAPSMEGGKGLPTRRIEPHDLDALGGLRHCPMMFQRYIPKARELRVVWIDGATFVGALDGARCGVDWRYEATTSWEHGALPAPAEQALGRLMRRLGLTQGALDLIETPEGELVFLEVNPLGEWGMLERDLGLPIGQAIADALLRRIDPGQHRA
ncbi:MAG: MvdC family ATP-grasp ribosomal peptide maturase [Polyangiaceae bacterium]|nr:MvdC family ATP-grasp ribosomal peptide maturase [Polyangiaceae bacterium]